MRNLFKTDIPANRVFGLDLIRCLGILAVVYVHGRAYLPDKIRHLYHYVIPEEVVTIFFVLSGYLIGNILIRSLQKDFSKKTIVTFWKRRWLRTLPAYFFVLCLLCIIHGLFQPGFSFQQAWKHFFFIQNVSTDINNGFFAVSWSLSIEEWFYFLTPLLIAWLHLLCKASLKTTILTTALSVIVVVTLYRYMRVQALDIRNADDWNFYFKSALLPRLDAPMYGVLAAWFRQFYPQQFRRYAVHLLAAGLILFIINKLFDPYFSSFNEVYNCVFAFAVLCSATFCIMPFFSNFHLNKGFFYRVVTKISLISYSMYLVHLAIAREWIVNKIGWGSLGISYNYTGLLQLALYWLLSIGLAILLYKYVELPVLKMRDRTTTDLSKT